MMEVNKIYEHNVMNPWPLPDKVSNTIVTSPPYWALRDYGVEGQLGLEKTPEEYIDNMVKVFREARRVLRDDGTLWLNIGDSFCAKRTGIIKAKDLVGIPWMLAFALRADGWYLRQDIIWHKPNPMPESASDRCTKAHEYLFMFSKKSTYYYNAYAIRTPYQDKTFTAFGIESSGKGDGSGLVQSENWANDVPVRKPKQWKMPDGWDTGDGAHGSIHRNGRKKDIRER